MNRSWSALAAESTRIAASTRVISGLVVLLAFAVPVAVLGVTGRNVEGQAAILARLDDAGARILTIVSGPDGAALPATAVDRIARLEGVTWVVGLGPVSDVRSGLGGGPAPLRAIRAIKAPVLFGHSARPGAFLSETSAARLGLGGAYGTLMPDGITVVGWFRATEPLGALEAFALIPSNDDALRLERIIVAVDDVGWLDLATAHLRDLIGSDAAEVATVEGSPALVEARAAVRDEVARRDRLLVVAIMLVAMALACVVVFTGTIGQRRDFGRRRALGATRVQLTTLVMAGTLWPAIIGAVPGCLVGWVYLGAQLGRPADPQFPLAVGVLVALALTLASALPAAHAATRDPLRVLRVP
jgi:putative ABC transport system permease protein